MNNPCLSVISDNGMARGFFVRSTALCNDAFNIHRTSPVATAALGRLLTASVLMGRTLKNDSDLLTLQLEGAGPIRSVLATANRRGEVKGEVGNPLVDIPLKPNGKLDVSGAIGAGLLTVLRDTGDKTPYVSRTELISGEIAEDITYYFASSEQVPTVCGLGVLVDRDYSVKSAGGFLIQLMPGADEETISALEKNTAEITNISSLFGDTSNEEIAARCFHGLGMRPLETWDASYRCNCSKERTRKVLLSIGRKELAKLISEGEPVELCCHFCNKKYLFSVPELQELLLSGLKK